MGRDRGGVGLCRQQPARWNLRLQFEQQLAGIWRSLLGLERVGRDDRFFELGGDSLTAMRTVTRIEALTGVRLTLRQLVSGSLGTLAEHVVESCRPRAAWDS
ncbi:hypothetical protein I8J32_007890 [Lysobacter solisilvae]|uniref:Carrier domain-containing protein n=1 Tax=Agrilutibacter solisilvae TaxID=2763317 RepID=A0A974Y228_9GAMM|nr:hypothetical protein I8J32_007890 [Lysobacter solisilvae]